MSKRPRPTALVLDRLRAIGDKDFISFLDEVSPEATHALLNYLPPVPGFRKTSPSSVGPRKKALAREFASKRGPAAPNRSRADQALYLFWRAWGQERLGDTLALGSLLDAIEEASEDEHPKGADEQAQPQILALFQILKQWSWDNRCSQEAIVRFLTFSPFEETPEITGLIESSKPAHEVERDYALSKLPERLHKDEEQLQSLEAHVRSLTARIDASAADIQNLQGEFAASSPSSGDAERAEKALSDLATALRSDIKTVAEQIAAVRDAAEKRDQRAGTRLDDLENLVLGLPDAAGAQAAELAVAVKALTDRVTQVEARPEPSSAAAPSSSAAPAVPSLVRVSRAEHPKPLKAVPEAVSFLASALEAIGMKAGSAALVAEEVLAASLLRQVISFRGAFGTLVARACATALAAAQVRRIAMPLGLQDATLIAQAATPDDGEQGAVRAIVIEGINLGPIEVIYDTLADAVAAPDGHALVFASMTSGLAAFPDQPLYLELGPIFDVDALDWKHRGGQAGAAHTGTLQPDVLEPSTKSNAKAHPDLEEALRLVRTGTKRRNPKIELNAIAFLGALESIRKSASPTSLQSMAFVWVMPLWQMENVSPDKMDDELDGGTAGAETADTRLVRLLAGARASKDGAS